MEWVLQFYRTHSIISNTVRKYKLTFIYFLQVPSRRPWLQGHSSIHGQRISATKANAFAEARR